MKARTGGGSSCGRGDCCAPLTQLRTVQRRRPGIRERERILRDDYDVVEIRICTRGHVHELAVSSFSRRRAVA